VFLVLTVCYIIVDVQIHLDHNNIQQLPAAIGQMGRVKLFDVSSNYIRVLPASIANMTELTTLNLSSNKL